MQNETALNTTSHATPELPTETIAAQTTAMSTPESTTPTIEITSSSTATSATTLTTASSTTTPTTTTSPTTPTTTTSPTTTTTTTSPTTPTTTTSPTTTTTTTSPITTRTTTSPTTTRTTTSVPGNLCKPDSCQNGGTCIEATYNYVCICPQDWTGINCAEKAVCNQSIHILPNINLTFHHILLGSTGFSIQVCGSSPNDGSPLATRQCVLNNGNLSLTEPVLFDCSKSLQSILDDLTTLNITTAASATLVLTSKPQSLTVKDVTTTTHILSKIMQDPTQLKQEIAT
ncbi:uncharacterized protein [Chiloscyllium punctatum]|uniref:uncharacterized protein n=1 Tax=Chiloscyllium punctatum TaxID=137246 RepID=UPI003B639BE1